MSGVHMWGQLAGLTLHVALLWSCSFSPPPPTLSVWMVLNRRPSLAACG